VKGLPTVAGARTATAGAYLPLAYVPDRAKPRYKGKA
jgi:hypothetical protein